MKGLMWRRFTRYVPSLPAATVVGRCGFNARRQNDEMLTSYRPITDHQARSSSVLSLSKKDGRFTRRCNCGLWNREKIPILNAGRVFLPRHRSGLIVARLSQERRDEFRYDLMVANRWQCRI